MSASPLGGFRLSGAFSWAADVANLGLADSGRWPDLLSTLSHRLERHKTSPARLPPSSQRTSHSRFQIVPSQHPLMQTFFTLDFGESSLRP